MRKVVVVGVAALLVPALALAKSTTTTNSLSGKLKGDPNGTISMQVVLKDGKPSQLKKTTRRRPARAATSSTQRWARRGRR